ncbi:MAG: tetratricopeptide repeat protein [bacterium]|nr:tetratricopeptide repeat protein [bacterium]
MGEILTNIIGFFTGYTIEVVFVAALLLGFVGLFYYFFRFNRDVFNPTFVIIVIFAFLLFAQLIFYLGISNIFLSGVVFGVWIIGLVVSLFIHILTSKQRIARERESKIAILPLLMEGDIEEGWVTGYGTADFVSRILQAYDISVLDPFRVAVGFVRRDLSDVKKAIDWAEMLDADFLITGNTRFVRDNVQVRYRIINIKDAREWQRRRLLLPKESVLELGRRMADDLVELFDLKVQNDPGLSYYKYPTNSLQAWEKYCEGRKLQLMAEDEDVERAVELFSGAMEIDEEFSLAETSTVEAYLTLARRRVTEEDDFLQTLETAYRIALRTVRRHPEIYESQNQMGEVFVFLSGGHDQELFRRAQTRFIEAVRLNPNSAKSWYNLAQISRYSAETEAETGYLGFLEKAVVADPSFVPTRVALARYYIENNDPDNAESEYKAALGFNPNNPQALNELADYYITNDQSLKAVAILQRAKEKEERNPQTRYYLGKALAETGNLIGAEEELWAAIAFKPSESGPYKTLAKLMEKRGKYAEAMGVLYEHLSYVSDKTEKVKTERHIKELMALAREQVSREGTDTELPEGAPGDEIQSEEIPAETEDIRAADVPGGSPDVVSGDETTDATETDKEITTNDEPPPIEITPSEETSDGEETVEPEGSYDVGDLIDLDNPELVPPPGETDSIGINDENLEDIV